MEINSVPWTASFEMATEADQVLPTYDHTKLSAINTCPTWGILRYDMHKQMPGQGRALALEAGSAMHECFAFIRLVTLTAQRNDKGASLDFTKLYSITMALVCLGLSVCNTYMV